jgi:signal recognition particle subunit SRP72
MESTKLGGLDLSFEQAYAHYRLNSLHKSLAVLDAVKNPQTKHAELRAQILYKLEQYGDCYAVYRSIVKSTSDEYETERRTNLSAVAVQLADRANVETEDLDTYELRSGNLFFGYF